MEKTTTAYKIGSVHLDISEFVVADDFLGAMECDEPEPKSTEGGGSVTLYVMKVTDNSDC